MNTLIDEKDISPARLSVLLEQAVIDHTVEADGSIRVHEYGWFPYWVHHRPNLGTVILSTYTEFRDTATELDRLRVVNEATIRTMHLAVCLYKDRLRFDTGLSCRDAMVHEHFIRACREFPQSVEQGIEVVDAEYTHLKRLSEVCGASKKAE